MNDINFKKMGFTGWPLLLGAVALLGSVAPSSVSAQDLSPSLKRLAPPSGPASAAPTIQGAYGESALPASDIGAGRAPGMQLQADGVTPFPPELAVSEFRARTESEVRSEAFDAALGGLLPLKPDEIRGLLEFFDKTRQSVEVPIHPYPTPEVVVKTVALDPGVLPPVIKVGTGHVSTLNILDITGAPWSIQDMSWAGNFEIIQPESGGNVLRITPMSEFAYGNISIRLIDLATPITFTIKTARDKIHYRFDARIPEFGPNAVAPLMEGGLQATAGDSTIGGILDGVAPTKSERLLVSGVDGRTTAYLLEEKTYVRTPLTLLSPGWDSSVTSADGMNVYALRNAPVLLMSDKGQVVRARLTRRGSDEDVTK